MNTRAQNRPSTPLSSELYHGMQQIARHNASTPIRHSGRGAAASYPSPLHSSVAPQLVTPSLGFEHDQGQYVLSNGGDGSYDLGGITVSNTDQLLLYLADY